MRGGPRGLRVEFIRITLDVGMRMSQSQHSTLTTVPVIESTRSRACVLHQRGSGRPGPVRGVYKACFPLVSTLPPIRPRPFGIRLYRREARKSQTRYVIILSKWQLRAHCTRHTRTHLRDALTKAVRFTSLMHRQRPRHAAADSLSCPARAPPCWPCPA